jgi:alkanesulfonate monooxygenase SsuD/methylene tetrahydromethanopterin reductase-like flavin-dependent oxidoreductase (luciferase family)
MKQAITFGLHLPVIRFNGEADRSREQILSFAKKADYLGYDSLSVNDHIVFRNTSWLDAITTLSAVAAITKLSIKLFIYESGPHHEEMEDVLCPKLRYLT